MEDFVCSSHCCVPAVQRYEHPLVGGRGVNIAAKEPRAVRAKASSHALVEMPSTKRHMLRAYANTKDIDQ